MNRTVQRRIAGMEARARTTASLACDTCRAYSGIVLRDDAGRLSQPESCPDCGRTVPVPHILHIVGVPLELP